MLEKIERAERAENRLNPGELFGFDLETRIQCSECKRVKYRTHRTTQLELHVQRDLYPADKELEKEAVVEFQKIIDGFFFDEMLSAKCSHCDKATLCSKRSRMVNYPAILVACVQRFVFDEWVPRKLNVKLGVPEEGNNLEVYRGHGPQESEQILEEAEGDEAEPELNPELLNQVIGCGVPELPAKHALHRTGNSSAEVAIQWFFENMEDPTL